ncbi:hypothetical protein WA026_021559, partial [Henosepilachna vigintioctopunctata]
ILIENSFDVLTVTETGLDSSTSGDFMAVPGYEFVRSDHPTRVGGIMLYYTEGIKCRTIHEANNLKVDWSIYGCNRSFIIEDWPWALCRESQVRDINA